MNTLAFHIPATWRDRDLSTMLSAGETGRSVHEVYGCLNDAHPSGRPCDGLQVGQGDVARHFAVARSLGIRTNYLLNADASNLVFCSSNEKDGTKGALWLLLESLRPDVVTCSDPALATMVYSRMQDIHLKISAIYGARIPADVSQFAGLLCVDASLEGACLHHDASVSWRKIAESNHSVNTEISVLVSESCFEGCPFRAAHYRSFARACECKPGIFFNHFQAGCVIKRLLDPASLLDLSGHVLPELIEEFAELSGVRAFKISGRSKSPDWIMRTTRAYLEGRSLENVFDQTVFTTPLLAERFGMNVGGLFYLNSAAYREVQRAAWDLSGRERLEFLRQASVRLFEAGALRIQDPGAEYAIVDGAITARKPGEYLRILLDVCEEHSYDALRAHELQNEGHCVKSG